METTGKEGVLFGKELSDEERINIGMKLMAPYLGNAITNVGSQGLNAFTDQANNLVQDIKQGTQLWGQMAIQSYHNAQNLASMIHFGDNNLINNNPFPKDKDAYIKLDITHELWQGIKSIGDTGKDLFTGIREAVRDYQQDYARYVAFKKGELTIEAIKKQVENGEVKVEDVYDLGVRVKRYGGDATALITLTTKHATNQDLMNLINKAERSGGKEISEALKVERNERIDKVIKELSSAINPQLASNSLIPVVDYKSAEGSLAKIIQLGGKIEAGGKITVPGINQTGQSTTTFIGVDNVVKEWWKGLLKDAGVSIEAGIAIGGFVPGVGTTIETIYDIFQAVSGYSLTGKLTPLERSLVIGAVFVPGVSGTLVKNAGKVAGEVLAVVLGSDLESRINLSKTTENTIEERRQFP